MNRVIAGKYHCLEKLGRGGSGDVYRAIESDSRREVAIKILKNCGLDEEQTKKLQANLDHVDDLDDSVDFAPGIKELKALSRLDGSHTIKLHTFGQDDRDLYLVMTYAPGETLRSLIKKGAMSPKRAVRLAIQVLKGLEEAHEKNIIHRDLKPENIVVNTGSTKGEHVRVIDFGIAIVAGLTQTMVQIQPGSLHYMSPEQAGNTDVVEQSDIYSLGVVLFEMLTGRPPFVGDINTILAGHIRCKPTWPKLSNVPKSLRKIVLKAMEKEPKNRYQSAQKMRIALEKWLNPPKTFFKKILGVLLFLAALLAFLANIDAAHNLWGKVKQSFFRSPSAQQVSDVQQPPLARRSQQTSTQQTFHIQQTATLRIDSSPQGASVVQQGAELELGKTPYVYQGSRNEIVSFQLRLPGYLTESISYTLTQSEATTSLILQPILSTLSVQSKPPEIRKLPTPKRALPKPRKRFVHRSSRIMLILTSSPSNAVVRINGSKIGFTPLTWNSPSPQEIRIVIRLDGYLDQSFTMQLSSGVQKRHVTLQPDSLIP